MDIFEARRIEKEYNWSKFLNGLIKKEEVSYEILISGLTNDKMEISRDGKYLVMILNNVVHCLVLEDDSGRFHEVTVDQFLNENRKFSFLINAIKDTLEKKSEYILSIRSVISSIYEPNN